MFTIAEIIRIGRISTYLSANDVAAGNLYGAKVNPMLPLLIAMETDSVDWQNTFKPADDTLRWAANYLYSLCGAYALLAQALVSAVGFTGGITANSMSPYLIPITGSMFTDSTNYDDTRIVGKPIVIFWNDVSRYLLTSEYVMTSTGVQILVDGFDAVANPTYKLYIYIIL